MVTAKFFSSPFGLMAVAYEPNKLGTQNLVRK